MKTILRKRVIAIILSLALVLAGMASLGNTEARAADDYAACIILADGTETKYVNFDDALDAWVTGSTLKLLKVITIDSVITVPRSGSYTLDLSRYGILQTCKDNDHDIIILDVFETELNVINSATEDYGKCYYLGIDISGRAISYSKLKPDIGKEGEDYIAVPCGFLAGGAAYNEAYYGFAIGAVNSVVTLENISIAGNAESSGVQAYKNSIINVKGNTSIIYNSSMYEGGGIYAVDSTVNITDKASIKHNSSDMGGGIYCKNSTLSLNGRAEVCNNQFSYDIDNAYGGGIYIEDGKADISGNVKIESNYVTALGNAYGGGIYASNAEINIAGNTTVVDNNVISKGNDSYAYGGGIYADNSKVIIGGNASIGFNLVFVQGERSCAAAGGIGTYGDSYLELHDQAAVLANTVTVDKETSRSYGGGVVAYGDIYVIGDAEISENEACSKIPNGAYGGGLFINDNTGLVVSGNVSIIDNRVYNNKVSTPNNVFVYDCAFEGPITVKDALTGKIGVNNLDRSYNVVEGVLANVSYNYNNGKISESDLAAFVCDNPDYKIVLNENGKAVLVKAVITKTDPSREQLPDTVIGWPHINVLKDTLIDLRVEGSSLGEYVIVDQDKTPVLGENTYVLNYVPYDTESYNTINNISWTFNLLLDIDDGTEIGILEKDETVEYTGSPAYQKLRLIYEAEDYELVEGIDYTRECTDINVGKATTTLKGIGRFCGETKFEFEIVKATPLPEELPDTWDKNPWLIDDYLYDLSQEESSKGQYAVDSDYYANGFTYVAGINDIHLHYNPNDRKNYKSIDVIWHVNLTHTECNKVLEETVLTEATPEAPGKIFSRYICTVCGYWSTAESYPYYLDINDCTSVVVNDIECNVNTSKPQVSIKYNDYQLVENKDYTVEYSGVNTGEATATIKGCGNFTGEKQVKYTIKDHETEVVERDRVESTCSVKGHYYRVTRCKKCGKELESVMIELPLKAHVEGSWETTVQATATTNGTRVKRCVNCETILVSEDIEATGTPTGSNTPTDTPSGTPTDTETPTDNPTGTGTSEGPDTPTGTGTDTPTGTETSTDIPTGTPVGNDSPTGNDTPTNTETPSDTSAGNNTPVGGDGETATKTDDTPVIKTEEPISKGSVVSDESGNADYEVTASGKKKNTVEFDSFDGDETTVEIPDTVKVNDKEYNVTSLDSKAFAGNTELKKVVLGENITKVSKNSFDGCTGLKKLVLSNNTKIIGANALNGCTALTSLNVTENVEHIRKNALAGCDNLQKLVIRSDKFTDVSEIKNLLNSLPENCTLHVTKGMKSTYKKLLKELKLTKVIKLKTIKNS